MDSAEPEESSNSQNVNTYIADIKERRAADSSIVEVRLSDGSSFFVLRSFIETAELKPGTTVTDEDVEALRYQSQLREAYDKALDLLARAEHSEGRMRLKLRKRRYGETVVDSVIELLREKAYLDNRRFAEQWVEVRLSRHPEGKIALIAGLIRRGVDRATAERVVSEHIDERRECESLRRAGEKLEHRYKGDAAKLYRSLLRRGFLSAAVRYYIDKNLKNGKNKA